MNEMMHIDMMGGAGTESAENREKLEYDNRHVEKDERTPGATFPATDTPARSDEKPKGTEGDADKPTDHDMHDMESMPGMDHGKTDPAPEQLNQ